MATEEGQDGLCQDKVVLKRKLTGPPRLLLGKSKSKNQGNDRSEARAKRNERLTVNNGVQISSFSPKYLNTEVEENVLPIVTLDDLHTCSNMEEEDASPEVVTEHTMLGSAQEEASGDNLDQNSKIKPSAKCGWKRIFYPAVICFRKQRKNANQSAGVPLHRASTDKTMKSNKKLVEEDCISLSVNNRPNDTVTKKKRFVIRRWPIFKRFLISTQDHQRAKPKRRVKHVQQSPPTFRNKLQRFFTRGGRDTSLMVPQVEVDLQDPGDREADSEPMSTQEGDKHKCSSGVQLDNTPQDGKELTEQCTEKVTVSADVSTLFSKERTREVAETQPGVSESLTAIDERYRTPNTEDPEDGQRDVKRETDSMVGERSMKTKEGLTCSTGTTLDVKDGLNVAMDANKVHTDEPRQSQCLDNKGIIEKAIDDGFVNTVNSVAMDTNEHLSDLSSIILLEDADEAKVISQEMDTVCKTTLENNLHNGQILTNMEMEGLSVLQSSLHEVKSSPMAKVDACDQDGNILVDEESVLLMKDHQDLVCTQRLLVQTARALVQAAMSAAMDQLLLEQQDITAIVHREAQECRDHA